MQLDWFKCNSDATEMQLKCNWNHQSITSGASNVTWMQVGCNLRGWIARRRWDRRRCADGAACSERDTRQTQHWADSARICCKNDADALHSGYLPLWWCNHPISVTADANNLINRLTFSLFDEFLEFLAPVLAVGWLRLAIVPVAQVAVRMKWPNIAHSYLSRQLEAWLDAIGHLGRRPPLMD